MLNAAQIVVLRHECRVFFEGLRFRFEDLLQLHFHRRHVHRHDVDPKTLGQLQLVRHNALERLQTRADLKDTQSAKVFHHRDDGKKITESARKFRVLQLAVLDVRKRHTVTLELLADREKSALRVRVAFRFKLVARSPKERRNFHQLTDLARSFFIAEVAVDDEDRVHVLFFEVVRDPIRIGSLLEDPLVVEPLQIDELDAVRCKIGFQETQDFLFVFKRNVLTEQFRTPRPGQKTPFRNETDLHFEIQHF